MVTQSWSLRSFLGKRIRGFLVRLTARRVSPKRLTWCFVALPAAFALGACALPEWESFRPPTADQLFRPLSVTNVKDRVLAPVASEDMVDASGRCAGAAVAPGGDQSATVQEAGVAMIPSAIALEMTECDVVKRAGTPERVDIGSTERNERQVTLAYNGGARPGVYTFISGRLKSMERGPEPVSTKPAKKPAKPPSKPRQVSVQ
jgi:hypothetical protein